MFEGHDEIKARTLIHEMNDSLKGIDFGESGIEKILILEDEAYNIPWLRVNAIIHYSNRKRRLMEIATLESLESLKKWFRTDESYKTSIYTTGMPLLIVDRIEAERVVAVVIKYLLIEQGMAQNGLDSDGSAGGGWNRDTYLAYDFEVDLSSLSHLVSPYTSPHCQ